MKKKYYHIESNPKSFGNKFFIAKVRKNFVIHIYKCYPLHPRPWYYHLHCRYSKDIAEDSQDFEYLRAKAIKWLNDNGYVEIPNHLKTLI